MSANNMTTLRDHLFDAIERLSDKKTPMEIDRAKAVAELGQVIINSAKAEIEFAKVTGQKNSPFLGGTTVGAPAELPSPVAQTTKATTEKKDEALPSGITGIRRHVMK